MAERRARAATDRAYAAAKTAYASKSPGDILSAGDLFRFAAALYERAAAKWKALGDGASQAEHCAKMAKRLASSSFAKASIVATYKA